MSFHFPLCQFGGSSSDITVHKHVETYKRTTVIDMPGYTNRTTQTNTETKILGKDGYLYGFQTNKGVFLAFYSGKECVILGKDGVSRCVHKEFSASSTSKKVANALGARFLGLLDTIQFEATAPIFLAAHSTVLVGATLGTILLLPAAPFSKSAKVKWTACASAAVANLGSVATISAAVVLTPIEIVAPELNFKVLKMQKWGRKFPESEGRMM